MGSLSSCWCKYKQNFHNVIMSVLKAALEIFEQYKVIGDHPLWLIEIEVFIICSIE